MRNHYLELLGLEAGATKQEVKKAYRRLAKLYHPDRNRDENAEEMFIAIHEAYKFLTEVGEHPKEEQAAPSTTTTYTSTTRKSYDYDPEQAMYEKWRAQARRYAREKARKAHIAKMLALRKVFTVLDYLYALTLVFNLVLIMDYLVPGRSEPVKIIAARTIHHREPFDRIVFEQKSMSFENGTIEKISGHTEAYLVRTLLFGTLTRLRVVMDGNSYYFRPYGTLFQVFRIVVPMVLMFTWFYYRLEKTSFTKLSWALLLFFTLCFEISYFVGTFHRLPSPNVY